MVGWLKQKWNDLLFKIFPILPSYIARGGYEEFHEKYKEFRIMTENKRFQVHKVIGSFHEWSIEDTIDDKIVFGSIMHKYEADRLCAKLNELSEQTEAVREELQLCEEENTELQKENEQLKQQLFETSKELLWATSDEVDRALHYEDEVEELRKEIFE